jgi:hypothetical protein
VVISEFGRFGAASLSPSFLPGIGPGCATGSTSRRCPRVRSGKNGWVCVITCSNHHSGGLVSP